MGRDYVTIREEQRDGDTVWMETSVGRARLKSVRGAGRVGTASAPATSSAELQRAGDGGSAALHRRA